MRLRALIQRLQEIDADLRAGLGDDVEPEVLAAHRPVQPLAREIVRVSVLDDEPVLIDGRPVVWIALGSAPSGAPAYAPTELFEGAE